MKSVDTGTLADVVPVRGEKATPKGRRTDEAFREAARLVFARDGCLNAKISDIAAAADRSLASRAGADLEKARELGFLAVGCLPVIPGWFPSVPDSVLSWC